MCGRSSLTKTEKELEERFNATFYSDELERYNPLPNFNVAPTHILPVLKNTDPEHFRPLRWGLIPFWAKDIRIGYKMINARIETVMEKAAFKHAMQKRRCIVPFDVFYEWKKRGKKEKHPYRIITTNTDIFSIAGLWEKWKSPGGEMIESFTLITQPPNKLLESIHDRMPAVLMPDEEKHWLDMDISPQDALELIKPYPEEFMRAYKVTKRVGKVSENDPGLIEEIKDSPPQMTMNL